MVNIKISRVVLVIIVLVVAMGVVGGGVYLWFSKQKPIEDLQSGKPLDKEEKNREIEVLEPESQNKDLYYKEKIKLYQDLEITINFIDKDFNLNLSDATNFNSELLDNFFAYKFSVDNYPHTHVFVEKYKSELDAQNRLKEPITFRIGAWPEYAKYIQEDVNERIEKIGNNIVVIRNIYEMESDKVSFGSKDRMTWGVASWNDGVYIYSHIFNVESGDTELDKMLQAFIDYFENEEIFNPSIALNISGNKILSYQLSERDALSSPDISEQLYYGSDNGWTNIFINQINDNIDHYCAMSGGFDCGISEAEGGCTEEDIENESQNCLNKLKSSELEFQKVKRQAYDSYTEFEKESEYSQEISCKILKNQPYLSSFCINKDLSFSIRVNFPQNADLQTKENFLRNFFDEHSFDRYGSRPQTN